MAVGKNLSGKSYLRSLNDALDAAASLEPDAIQQFIANTTSGLIPMSSALRTYNPDPYMRDAKGIVDKVAAGLPGFSEKLPIRRDYGGEPVLRSYGLVFKDKASDIADAENQRMLESYGFGITPLIAAPRGDVDLRRFALKDGQTAFDRYQELSMKPKGAKKTMKQQLGELIQSKNYALLPDGPADLKGTKTWALGEVVQKYRLQAYKQLLAENPDLAKATASAMQRVQQSIVDTVKSGKASNDSTDALSRGIEQANKTFGIGN